MYVCMYVCMYISKRRLSSSSLAANGSLHLYNHLLYIRGMYLYTCREAGGWSPRPKGSSMISPISSVAKRIQDTKTTTGATSKGDMSWLSEKGSESEKRVKKREVCRE